MTHAQVRVLLVEDSAHDRQILQLACRRATLAIDWLLATSCQEAREVFADISAGSKPAPHIAILDQRLPDGLGTDLLASAGEAMPGAILAIFSTSDAAADRQRVPADSGVHYVVKPHRMAGYDEIIGLIRAAVS